MVMETAIHACPTALVCKRIPLCRTGHSSEWVYWQGRYVIFIMWQLVKEFAVFLKEQKKWWLIPLLVVLLVLALLIVFGSSSVLAPFMYPFM